MAQSITWLGNTYTQVAGIQLPKTGGGTALFSDASVTTAVESDVSSGKIFIKADGSQGTGTNSGGGGASNVVQGTFTTGGTGNTTGTFTIPYTGNGYPVALVVYVTGGAYNNTTSGDTTWYNSMTRYDVGWYSMVKGRTTSAPTYETSGADNYGNVAIIYKNSTSNNLTYARTSTMTANTFSSSSAAASTACIRFKGNKTTVSYYIGNGTSSSMGFAKNTELSYIAIYSE